MTREKIKHPLHYLLGIVEQMEANPRPMPGGVRASNAQTTTCRIIRKYIERLIAEQDD